MPKSQNTKEQNPGDITGQKETPNTGAKAEVGKVGPKSRHQKGEQGTEMSSKVKKAK
jgi:hypothetical protein